MHGDIANGTTPTGESIPGPDAGELSDNIANGGEPGSSAERGDGEPGGVRNAADSTGSEAVSAAVSGRSTTDETGQRPDAASADEDRAAGGQRVPGGTSDWLKEKERNMAGLLELLKAAGASEADLEQMKPLLSNDKFTSAIEGEFTAKTEWERKAAEASGKLNEFESQRNQFEVKANEAATKLQQYDDWYNNQVTPALKTVNQKAMEEAARAAAAEARLAKAKELYGFEIPDDVPANGGNPPVALPTNVTPPNPLAANTTPTPRQDLPDLSQYVKLEDINRQADMVGQAIAQTQDLAWEHQQLFGYSKPVNFTDLRAKAVAEKRPIREIWERELHVADRKAEIAANEQKERDAKYQAELAAARQEGFEKGMSQSINPMTREPVNSRFAVAFTKRDSDAGKPWEARSGREADRLQKVVSSLAKQA
jgi:hypothetical protein